MVRIALRMDVFLVILMAFISIASSLKKPKEEQNKKTLELTSANNAFTRDLFKIIASQKPRVNVFLSPFSVSSALAMLQAGAKGRTLSQMQTVLHTTAISKVEKRYQRLLKIIKRAKPKRSLRLKIANAVFTSENANILPKYARLLKTRFKSKLHKLNFLQNKDARKKINKWVEQQTARRIKDLIPDGAPSTNTLVMLVSAIYFNGAWLQPFSENSTFKGDFNVNKKKTVQVKIMNQNAMFRTGSDDRCRCRVIELPYKGNTTSMYVMLPQKRHELGSIDLTQDFLQDIERNLTRTRTLLKLPRFKVKDAHNLENTLSAMGMSDLFAPRDADLSGINGQRNLYVKQVFHKTFIDVSERGTEAAAATGIQIIPMSMPYTFDVNEPFYFIIRHNPTKSILFIGRITNPKKK